VLAGVSIVDMDGDEALRGSASWWTAVWGYRVAMVAVVVIVAGLVTMVASTGSGQWIIAAGMGLVVVADLMVLTGISRAGRSLPGKRPPFRTLRRALLHDALHGAA